MSEPEPERREIDELITLHEVEPTLKEVVVEGSTDKELIEWFLGEHELADITVLAVEDIEVPAAEVLKRGLEDNNRGRVITLADLLEPSLKGTTKVTLIADKDFDRILGIQRSNGLLLLTDYTSMELYAFNVRSINKLLHFVIRGFPKDAPTVLQEIKSSLQCLFLVRLAHQELKYGLDEVSFKKSCQLQKGLGVVLSTNKYLQSLTRSNKALQLALEGKMNEFEAALSGDPRDSIHGHDFVNLLAWYVREHKNYKDVTDDAIERSIPGIVELADFDKEGMFQELLSRAVN